MEKKKYKALTYIVLLFIDIFEKEAHLKSFLGAHELLCSPSFEARISKMRGFYSSMPSPCMIHIIYPKILYIDRSVT